MPNSNGGIWKGIQNSVANHPAPVAVILLLLILFLVVIFIRPRVFDRTRGLVTRFGRSPAPPVEVIDTDDEDVDEDKEPEESFRARRRRASKRTKRVGMKR